MRLFVSVSVIKRTCVFVVVVDACVCFVLFCCCFKSCECILLNVFCFKRFIHCNTHYLRLKQGVNTKIRTSTKTGSFC